MDGTLRDTMSDLIAVTLDTDWAHDEVIAYTMDILNEHGVRATYFATNESPVLKKVDGSRFEIGIHPDFNGTLDHESKIKELLSIYPDAKGVRSHTLFHSWSIMDLFKKYGFVYDSNIIMPYFPGLRPIVWFNNVVRIPYFWEDEVHLLFGKQCEPRTLMMGEAGLKIYNFHPIHIFLNTEDLGRIEAARGSFQRPDKLEKHRNTRTRGCKDIFLDVLGRVRADQGKTYRMIDIASDFRASAAESPSD